MFYLTILYIQLKFLLFFFLHKIMLQRKIYLFSVITHHIIIYLFIVRLRFGVKFGEKNK